MKVSFFSWMRKFRTSGEGRTLTFMVQEKFWHKDRHKQTFFYFAKHSFYIEGWKGKFISFIFWLAKQTLNEPLLPSFSVMFTQIIWFFYELHKPCWSREAHLRRPYARESFLSFNFWYHNKESIMQVHFVSLLKRLILLVEDLSLLYLIFILKYFNF